EPGLQGRRHAEVVHGRSDDDRIGSFEFGDQLVGQGSGNSLGYVSGLTSAEDRSGVDIQMRDGTAAEIAGDNPEIRIVRTEMGDGLLNELVGHGGVAERTA